MKGTIFCSLILIWLINVLHCRHYLVEVADDDQGKTNPDNPVTPAEEEESEDDTSKEDTSEDQTYGMDIPSFRT